MCSPALYALYDHDAPLRPLRSPKATIIHAVKAVKAVRGVKRVKGLCADGREGGEMTNLVRTQHRRLDREHAEAQARDGAPDIARPIRTRTRDFRVSDNTLLKAAR